MYTVTGNTIFYMYNKNTMSNSSLTKGKQAENELIELLIDDGFNVRKVASSGSGKYEKGDIALRFKGAKYLIECKREKSLPIKGLETRKADNDMLIMRQNHDDWKVYLDLNILIKLLLNNRS